MATNPFDPSIQTLGAPAMMPPQAAPIAGKDALGNLGGAHLQGYIPQGFAMMLARLAQNPQFQQMLAHGMLANRLQQFGLTPDQITAPGFDPNQLYNRQMARADIRAGIDPLAAGSMVPQGYTPAPTYHPFPMMGGGGGGAPANGWTGPIGMTPPQTPTASAPAPLNPLAPGLAAPAGPAGGGSMPQIPGRRVYGQGGPANSY